MFGVMMLRWLSLRICSVNRTTYPSLIHHDMKGDAPVTHSDYRLHRSRTVSMSGVVKMLCDIAGLVGATQSSSDPNPASKPTNRFAVLT